MKYKIKLIIYGLLLLISQTSEHIDANHHRSNHVSWFDRFMNTRLGLHLWICGSTLKHGTHFTFHQIAGDPISTNTLKNNTLCIHRDDSGAIIAINDGKITPLVLGSIPTKKNHINQLCRAFSIKFKDAPSSICLLTLNQDWECQTSGLCNVIKKNNFITQFHYPTPDLHAPSLIDILRAVKNLEYRDNLKQQIVLVHCKAGRGRSATIIGAYLIHAIHKAGQQTNVIEIEKYLISRRSCVHLEPSQKEALFNFYQQLQQAETFEKLYAIYAS